MQKIPVIGEPFGYMEYKEQSRREEQISSDKPKVGTNLLRYVFIFYGMYQIESSLLNFMRLLELLYYFSWFISYW